MPLALLWRDSLVKYESYNSMTISVKMALLLSPLLAVAVLVNARCYSDDVVAGDTDSLRQDYLRYSMENPGDAEQGKALFNHSERALCSKCHLLTGMEKSGPNLDGIAWW